VQRLHQARLVFQRSLGGGVGGGQLRVRGLQLLGHGLRLGHLVLRLRRLGLQLRRQLRGGEQVRLGLGALALQPLHQGIALRLNLPPRLHVVQGAGPLLDLAVVAQHGDAARLIPAVRTVGQPQAVLGAVRAPGAPRVVPAEHRGRAVVGMDGGHPAGAAHLFQRLPRQAAPPGHVLHHPVGIGGPHHDGVGFHQRPQPGLAAQHLGDGRRGCAAVGGVVGGGVAHRWMDGEKGAPPRGAVPARIRKRHASKVLGCDGVMV
jgi:hypothetical protein